MAGTITPSAPGERTHNVLRPERLEDIIGQDGAKQLMKRACDAAFIRRQPLDHTLIVAASGMGKTTFATCIATDLGVDCYQLAAPVSLDTLVELRETMQAGDVLFVDEIHMQAVRERRGRDSATEPEVWFALMEDRILMTSTGPLDYPAITVIGATTDPGMLPEPFINRFPLRPRLVPYTEAELETITRLNAESLELEIEESAIPVIAGACRGLPREANNLMRNAAIYGAVNGRVSAWDARQVLESNGLTEDGLTPHMQDMLTFLYTRGRREKGDGTVTYQASVSTIATAIGLSRDVKAVALHVEPYLIMRGFVQVGHGGRLLTEDGVDRAEELAI